MPEKTNYSLYETFIKHGHMPRLSKVNKGVNMI